ncbi:uncharacterized protein ACRADG_012768 [Cochliomyia hominivorax]
MNTFTIFMCFALVATAVGKPGYNYQQPQQAFVTGPGSAYSSGVQQQSFVSSGPGPVYSSGGHQQSFVSSGPGPVYSSGGHQQSFVSSGPGPVYSSGSQYAQQQFSAPQFGGSSSQFVGPVQSSFAPSSSFVPSTHTNYAPQQQTIVSKEIYIHSAPEETEEIHADQGLDSVPNRKNYRIVFIKAPSQNIKLNLESLKRAQAQNEEKTVIYVLSKKPDLGNLQSQLTAAQTEQTTHKPEVYFIKYRTQEEANRAQQEIQAQYDALGGSTHISDEGYAPVTSVIGGKSVGINSVGTSGAPVYTGGSSYSSGSVGGSLGGSSYSSGSVSGSSYSSGSSFSSGSNFVQSSYQGSSGSTVSFGSETPSNKYLPAQKK